MAPRHAIVGLLGTLIGGLLLRSRTRRSSLPEFSRDITSYYDYNQNAYSYYYDYNLNGYSYYYYASSRIDTTHSSEGTYQGLRTTNSGLLNCTQSTCSM
eukprot:55594-Amphidinium_carterae.1